MPRNRIVYGLTTWDFIEISGHPDLPGQTLKTIQKDGVDGVAFKEMAFTAQPTSMYLRGLAINYADLQLFIANVKNLQGCQVSIYTSTETLYNGVVILNTTHNSTKFLSLAQWGANTYTNCYEIRWQMTVQYPYGSF